MFGVCHGVAAALETVVMLPALVQAILPSLPSSKHLQDVIPVHCRTMDEYMKEVKRLFEAPLKPPNLLSMSEQLQEQFTQKLKESDISMLPSFNHTLPTGHERGTFLALDVGGSTFRVALVQLCGKDSSDMGMKIAKMRSFRIDKRIRDLKGHYFFDWMAERIEEVLADPEWDFYRRTTLSMGLAWSFPIEYVMFTRRV